MPTDKKAQEAESRARAEAGIDPAMNAAALDVIDDVDVDAGGSPPRRAQGFSGTRLRFGTYSAEWTSRPSFLMKRW